MTQTSWVVIGVLLALIMCNVLTVRDGAILRADMEKLQRDQKLRDDAMAVMVDRLNETNKELTDLRRLVVERESQLQLLAVASRSGWASANRFLARGLK